ncbi:MAG: hypothetical protein C0501_21895 [Isosphaera sp.]|nr:hypothetical protein [Isosphaera sp.]
MRAYVVVLLAAAPAAGCGRAAVAPVSGRVTVDGGPAAGVHVGFQPVGSGGDQHPGGGSYGVTDADGRFTLRLVEGDGPGAVVGRHRVELTVRAKADDRHDTRPAGPKSGVVIPPKYNRNSDLIFEVPAGGTEAADFEVKTK